MKGATTMFEMIKTSNGGTAKRNALVKSVSVFAIASAVLLAGAASAPAAQDGISRLVAVTQMKADAANAEELQAKEGKAENFEGQAENFESMQLRQTTVIPPTNEELQQQKLRSRSGKAQELQQAE
jgi:hypothetical protein